MEWGEEIRTLYSLAPSAPTPEEVDENGDFTLKTHPVFTAHTTPEQFKKAAINGHF